VWYAARAKKGFIKLIKGYSYDIVIAMRISSIDAFGRFPVVVRPSFLLASPYKNSGKQRKNSGRFAVLSLALPSGTQDFRHERDVAR